MKEAECPWCGQDNEINHDDGYGYGDDLYEQNCQVCDNTFYYSTCMWFSYSTYKEQKRTAAERGEG